VKKITYFTDYIGEGWPPAEWLAPYFLTSSGRRKFFALGNDSWGLKVHGIDGTENLDPYKGRVDVDLTILGHPDLGILLFYQKAGGGQSEARYSVGDLARINQWVQTVHDKMPMGLFVPFETAWRAVNEFLINDGALPNNITWIAAADLPPGTFPAP
jgi:hypothetical protein